MFNFFNKPTNIDFSMDAVEEQCIPYACHYNEHTLLTKNGELMQVIKIEGLSKEIAQSDNEIDLRTVIRNAIMENVQSRKVAIWFHTIRRKHNLDGVNYFSWAFARDNHDGWVKKNHWSDKFVNELYITILYQGEPNNNFALSLVPKLLKKHHMNALNENSKTLDDLVAKVLNALKIFGGKRLSIVHDHLGAHCEILEFLSKVVCLRSKRVAVPIMGLDQIFCQSKIAFGGASLEVLDEDEKHYAAIFTIKEYHEFSAKALDKLLRASSEYVITQTLNFTNASIAKQSFAYFDYILGVSKDTTLREYCGLRATMESDHGKMIDYATQQMSIMVIGNTIDELKSAISNVVKEVSKLGMIVIREDLNIALSYWSQLPGNFNFFRRASYINTSRTAGFASLHNTPSGQVENPWGLALTIFRRENGAPHFFSLHTGKSAHTLVSGITDSAKSTLVNFLLSEASKYDPKILYIDQFINSQVTLRALGGKYETTNTIALNPFSLNNNAENYKFLSTWLLLLLFPEMDHTKEQEKLILEAILQLYKKPRRQLSNLVELIPDTALKEKLLSCCRPNKIGLLFDNATESDSFDAKIFDLNITDLDPALTAPFMLYCMHRFQQNLDNSPSIIVINDANQLLQNKAFATMLPVWLENLTTRNAHVIFICDVTKKICKNITDINKTMVTQLFLPDVNAAAYQASMQLNKAEVDNIRGMKLIYRHFMIKQNNEIIIVELNLDGMDYAIKALMGNNDAISVMEKAIATHGDNANIWLLPFYKNLLPKVKLLK